MSVTRFLAVMKRSTCVGAAALGVVACGGAANPRPTTAPIAVIYGTVTAGPTCPVERVGDPCATEPLAAMVRASHGTHLVASTRSAAPDGRYRVDVPPGAYTIEASANAALPRCVPQRVDVVAATSIEVDVSCDTGIR